MSFGLRDKDWIDPPDNEASRMICNECSHWCECPCGCGCGWCSCCGEFTESDEHEECDGFSG